MVNRVIVILHYGMKGMEYFSAARQVNDRAALLRLLYREAITLGFEAVAYLRPSTSDIGRMDLQEVGFPEGWAIEYLHEQYFLHDPHLSYVVRTGRCIQFSNITEKRELSAAEGAYLERLLEWKLGDGFLVPAFGTLPMPGVGLTPYPGWFSFRQLNGPAIDNANVAVLEAIAQATHIQSGRIDNSAGDGQKKLAPREVAILNWMALGKTNGEIGTILGIATPTVATYVRRLYNKLEVSDRTAAAVKGVKLGLVDS